MKENKLRRAALLLASTGSSAAGQLFFKIGVTSGATSFFLSYIAIGVVAYVLSTVLYLYVLSTTHLSWAYGFVGFSYIFAGILAFAFLGEQISPLRWLGIAVVSLGTLMIGMS